MYFIYYFFYSFVFFTCYMIGRHSARHPMYLLGIAYGGTLLTMSLGRTMTLQPASSRSSMTSAAGRT